MSNRLVCMEGSIHFDDEVVTQSIDVIMFKTGEKITINRDTVPAGMTLADHISQQINNAEKFFKQFSLIKMEEIDDRGGFVKIIQVIYSFESGSGQRVWQATYACLLSDNNAMVFTALYPAEASMQNEIHRLKYCISHFKAN